MEQKTKQLLVYICIVIVCLIIIRCLYFYLNNDKNWFSDIDINIFTNKEGFAINDDPAIDLLTKSKSSSVQQFADSSSNNLEMQIHSWSTKIYNMQNTSQQVKSIALYKPTVFIKGIQYCKLGDMISQNTDYSPPSNNEFSLLIKKDGSDIKPPTKFELMVDLISPNFNSNYYTYDQYISNPVALNSILPNLQVCSQSYSNLNTLIQNNLNSINTILKTTVYSNAAVTVNGANYSVLKLIRNIGNSASRGVATSFVDRFASRVATFQDIADESSELLIENFDSTADIFLAAGRRMARDFEETPVYYPPPIDANDINSYIQYSNVAISLPAGVVGYMVTDTTKNFVTKILDIPSIIDGGQKKNKQNILSQLPSVPYANLPETKLRFVDTEPISIYNNVPITQIFDFLKTLCNNIQTIYINQNLNKGLLKYLNLANSIDDVKAIIDIINNNYNKDIATDTINSTLSFSNVSASLSQYINSTLLGSIIHILSTMTIKYSLTYIDITSLDIAITNPYAIAIKSFNNDITSNIPESMYNIYANPDYSSRINRILPNLSYFTKFVVDLGNNAINYFPLQIYKPIAPDGYTSLGHIFCNINTDLDKIKDSNNVACIPTQCIKVMRNWVANDKVFEYNKNGVYWAIYFNPFTGTFISTNTNAQQLPEGSVCKVVACVAKCTAVDELEKADDCTRKYYNLNKKLTGESQANSSSKLVSDQEEIFYIDKLKAQSDSIARLKTKAQQMQTSIDKATIVNREMNKSKLQNYVDTQKQNIDIIMKRLKADKNKIQTNVNIPQQTLLDIINMIKKSSDIPKEQKTMLINKLIDNQDFGLGDSNLNDILSSCPQYDLSNLVKKTMVGDVCYGCDTPD